jgi:hypothetical protein
LTEYFGILLGIVQFDDVTLNKNILLDNFDTENLQYIPPACGLATTWYNGGYAYGYNCYGTGCLDEPIPIQKPDPNPLPNIESGTTPPKTWTKTMTACAECPAGQTNAPADNLIPVMTGYTSPSGSVSSSYGPIVGYEPWKAFDQDDETMWISPIEIGDLSYLSYTFPEAQTVAEYALTILRYENGNLPRDWVFEGSTDGATWTTLDTRSDELWLDLSGDPERRLFNVASPISCRYYRIRFTDVELPGIGSTIDTAYIAVVALEMFGGTTPQKVCKEATATSNVSSYAAEKAAYDAAYALALAELDCGEVFTATEEVTLKCPAGTCGPDVTRSATAISYVSEEDAIKQAQKAATAAAQAVIDADCAESNNTHYATIPDMGAITPFPLVKNVEDMTGTITKVTVSILGLSHTWPSDIELFLSHRDPDGTVTSVGLMKGCGNSTAITDVDIVFDDTGVALSTNTGTPAPEDEIIDGTTYMPTEGGVAGTWAFGGAVTPVTPTVPTSFSLADFIGQDPNGQWSLWGCDDALGNSGSIARGFDVTITTA